MPEYDYRFRTISEYNYTHPTPDLWQAWHEAYFRRITGVLKAGGEPVRLFDSGCTTESWTVPNCTRTCSDAEHMFSSPENVWNCMALAAVTMEVVPGNKTVDPASLKQMNDQFNFGGSLEAFDKLYVFKHVRRCFWQSCSDSKYGNCTSSLDDFRCNPIDQYNIQTFSRAINDDYCRNANLGVDADIAGPGILVAYMVQIALVLMLSGIFWMTRRPWDRLKTAVRHLFGASGNALTPETSKKVLDPKHANRVTLAVHSTVSEMQEAQTAFGLTIGVIFLCAFTGVGGLGLANVSSVLSYSVNRDIAFGLLVVGTFSIAFLQPCRQRVGRHTKSRWVSMSPMLASWLLMMIAHGFRAKGGWADPEHLIKILRENAAVEGCGNNPGPMSFCLGPLLQGPDESERVFETTITLAPAVHVLLAIILLEEWVIRMREKPESKISRFSSGWFCWVLSPVLFIANILMLILCLVEVVKAFIKIQQINGGQYSWGFGQLVAMAVWIPVVANFLTFLIVGTEKGTEARIHRQLQVSRVGTTVRTSQGRSGENGSDEAQSIPLLRAPPSTTSIQTVESNASVAALNTGRL